MSSPQYHTSNLGNCASSRPLWPDSEVGQEEEEEEDVRPRGSVSMESFVLICETGCVP